MCTREDMLIFSHSQMKKPLVLTAQSLTLILTLIACLPPPREPEIPGQSPAGLRSSHASSVPADIEVELPEELAPEEPVAGTGSLAERAMDAGTLEMGLTEAPLQLRVFTNPACAYCKQFAQEHLPRLERELVDDGRLRIEFIITPFKKFPNSAVEAAALYCAAKQGRGRAALEALTNLSVHDRKAVLALSPRLTLNAKEFTACIDAAETKALVEAQQDSSMTLIPTFMIGTERITGLPLYPDLRGWIREKIED